MELCILSKQAQLFPDHPALITPERTWTYRELNSAVHSYALFLSEQGIAARTHVAFIAHNTPATILLLFALFRIGAVACPLSHRIPDALLSEHLCQLSATHFLTPTLLTAVSTAPDFTVRHSQWATLLLTSGSSGTPKAACHSLGNHLFSALQAGASLKLTPLSRWFLSLPLFHVSGLAILFRCFAHGAAVVLSPTLTTEGITHLSLVPTQLHRLLQNPQPHSLKCILLGGAPLSDALLQAASHLPLYTTYGMTEMSSMVTLSTARPEHAHAGKPLPETRLRIENEEIYVSGKTLFQGYWDAQSHTLSPPGEWFATKDLGKYDSDGNLLLIGRKDRQFISGGENIQPEEIERALQSVPGIRAATVLPIPDPEFGERPVAFIDDATQAHTLETIRAALEDCLASFKHPVSIQSYPAALLQTGIKPTPARLREHLQQLM